MPLLLVLMMLGVSDLGLRLVLLLWCVLLVWWLLVCLWRSLVMVLDVLLRILRWLLLGWGLLVQRLFLVVR